MLNVLTKFLSKTEAKEVTELNVALKNANLQYACTEAEIKCPLASLKDAAPKMIRFLQIVTRLGIKTAEIKNVNSESFEFVVALWQLSQQVCFFTNIFTNRMPQK